MMCLHLVLLIMLIFSFTWKFCFFDLSYSLDMKGFHELDNCNQIKLAKIRYLLNAFSLIPIQLTLDIVMLFLVHKFAHDQSKSGQESSQYSLTVLRKQNYLSCQLK